MRKDGCRWCVCTNLATWAFCSFSATSAAMRENWLSAQRRTHTQQVGSAHSLALRLFLFKSSVIYSIWFFFISTLLVKVSKRFSRLFLYNLFPQCNSTTLLWTLILISLWTTFRFVPCRSKPSMRTPADFGLVAVRRSRALELCWKSGRNSSASPSAWGR